MELSSSYSCVPNFYLALVICLPCSSYAIWVLCPYGYSYARVLLCYRYSLYLFHMQSMFRLVDLCYGIGLMILLIALVLKHVKSVPWGIRVLINNASMVFGLLVIIRCISIPTIDRGRQLGGDSPSCVAIPQRTGGRKSLNPCNTLADQCGVCLSVVLGWHRTKS